jgi:hypothetical protein
LAPLAALAHPEQHRAQALGREPTTLQVKQHKGTSVSATASLHYSVTHSSPWAGSRENLGGGRRKAGQLKWEGTQREEECTCTCLGGERLLNALVLHGGGDAMAAEICDGMVVVAWVRCDGRHYYSPWGRPPGWARLGCAPVACLLLAAVDGRAGEFQLVLGWGGE